MDISELTLKILLLFIPGIVAILIIDMFTNHLKKDLKYFLFHSYLLSVGSYLIYSLFFRKNTFLESLLEPTTTIDMNEILQVSIIGILLGIVITYIINFKLLYKLGFRIRLSKKFGEGEVWESVVSDSNTSWVTIRDRESGLVYLGKIGHFSDSHKKRELVLSEVDIYSDSGDYFHSQDEIYFDFPTGGNLIIEIGSSYSIHGKEVKQVDER
jgi:hypothetical protein